MGVGVLRSSISLSLAVHLFFILAWAAFISGRVIQQAPPRLTWIEVDPAPRSAVSEKKRSDSQDHSKRVVQTRDGRKVDEASRDAFLGRQNQVVDRETVSAGKTTQMGVSPRARSAGAAAGRERSGQLSRLGIPIFPRPDLGSGGGLGRAADTQWVKGDLLPQDYVRGLKESEHTALNTKEFVFYGYFQRIRERLDRAWASTLRDHLYRMDRRGRRLASDMDHTTRTVVTLNSRGEIVRVRLVEESGTADLDEAAIEAFNQAGPFPNPPKGMVDINGLIEIRWDFILRS